MDLEKVSFPSSEKSKEATHADNSGLIAAHYLRVIFLYCFTITLSYLILRRFVVMRISILKSVQ